MANRLPPKKGAAPAAGTKPATKAPATPPAAGETEATTSGSYPWLRNRFKSALVDKAKDDQKKQLRADLKDVDSKKALALAQKAGVISEDPADIIKFILHFLEAGVTASK
jgi:hypothetical protein